MSKKISELPAATTLTDNDELVVNHIDTSGTDPETITSRMTAANLKDQLGINGKADKVSGGTSGNFASLDSNGNLTDSGNKASDFLTAHQTIKQDGITGATVNRFGTCSTGASTAAKTVSITSGTFSLEAGARVAVKFSNANTASTPTLNVGDTGAKNIYYKGSQITTAAIGALLRGVVEFIYDGTQWHLIGAAVESESAASSGTDLSLVTTGEKNTWNNKQDALSAMTQSDADNGTATTARSITAKVLNDATVKKAQTLYGETMLSSSANLNTYKAPTYKGNYYYYIAGHSISNMPTGLSGQPFRLTVESLGDKEGNIATGTGELDIDYTDATLQTLIVTNINNQNEVKTYRRTCVNSVWKDWVSYEDEIAKLNSGLIVQKTGAVVPSNLTSKFSKFNMNNIVKVGKVVSINIVVYFTEAVNKSADARKGTFLTIPDGYLPSAQYIDFETGIPNDMHNKAVLQGSVYNGSTWYNASFYAYNYNGGKITGIDTYSDDVSCKIAWIIGSYITD